MLGARGSGFVVFWDWESGEVVRRIDADAKNVSDDLLIILLSGSELTNM